MAPGAPLIVVGMPCCHRSHGMATRLDARSGAHPRSKANLNQGAALVSSGPNSRRSGTRALGWGELEGSSIVFRDDYPWASRSISSPGIPLSLMILGRPESRPHRSSGPVASSECSTCCSSFLSCPCCPWPRPSLSRTLAGHSTMSTPGVSRLPLGVPGNRERTRN